MNLVIVGTMAYDAIETPLGKTDKIIGGSATYASLSASYFTKNIGVVSVVGEDFSIDKLNLMQQKNISLGGVEIKKGEKSFFWSGKYHSDMNSRDTLVTELNVLANFNPVVPENYKPVEFLMLGNLTPSVQLSVIEQAESSPKLIALDTMNFWIESALDELKNVVKLVDILIINDEEARQLSGEYSIKRAAKVIMDMGPQILVIKKGEHGALLFKGDNIFFAPALPLEEVFDPTGAGDTFAGGFMGYLANTQDLSFDNMKRAIIYGSAMASFCVEKFGTERLLDLSTEEIELRVEKFARLVDFSRSFVS